MAERSYNGWPTISSSLDGRLETIEPVPGRKFRVRRGDVATVFSWLIRRFHDEVEAIDTGVLDDWSYAYRKVRGGTSPSNHASATAVDLNATRHPFNTKAVSNFTPAQISAIRRILSDAQVNGQPVIRWLDAHDPMHFEINYVARGGTEANVAALAARLREAAAQPGSPVVVPDAPAGPGLPAPAEAIPPRVPRAIEWRNPPADLVRIVQRIVGAKIDGERGPETIRKTKALQKRLGLKQQDGHFGADTAEAYLLSVPNLHRTKADEEMPRGAVELVQWIAGLGVDGSFGDGTKRAVQELQVWAGLSPIDGNVGDDTKRKITT